MEHGWPKDSAYPPVPGRPIGPAGALLVVPTRALNLPSRADTFAVIHSGLGPSCEPVYRPLQRVRISHPVGTKMAITGESRGRTLGGAPLVHSVWDDVFAETLIPFDPSPISAPIPVLARETVVGDDVVASERQAEEERARRAWYVFEFLRDLHALDRARTVEEREHLLLRVLGNPGGRAFPSWSTPPCLAVQFLNRHLASPSESFMVRLVEAGYTQPGLDAGCPQYGDLGR